MRYRLIAIDLDGTLLCPKGEVSEENRDALHAAHEAGALVIPCTGRGWRESRSVFASIPDRTLGVFNTGAIVCELDTGQTRNRVAFERGLTTRIVELMSEGEEAVLLYTDGSVTGYDYIVTGRGEPTEKTRWWFNDCGLRWTTQPELDDAVLDHVVRVGAIARVDRAVQTVDSLREAFGGQIEAFSFGALQDPGSEEPTHIVECFVSGVTKWRGIGVIAAQHGVRPEEVAVIGDQINDVPMFEMAGCAVAMGNAIDAVRDLAHYHTLKNDEHGVAHAIGKMLDGEW